MENKLPLHTRLGMYATGAILTVLCVLMLKSCVSAVYYGGKITNEDAERSYEAGFSHGLKDTPAMIPQSEGKKTNPLLLKKYQKGFRDGRDYKKMKGKKEIL
ncbi:MAG: hypothetical protein DSY50_00860 [Desulfobulbus sp.]|nr:MAG: hypothetical protein DSY50_00860 [Desulfobulbus sp.]RUM41520.1 MAG: hypothetical protein DSY70_01165 [Desulfobulbus sp.]